jgi:ribonuclease HI
MKARRYKTKWPRTPPKTVDPATYETGLHVFCDGACDPNPGRGGWGFVVYLDGQEIHTSSGGVEEATNNVMEMTGALRAVEWLAANYPRRKVNLHSDSLYVVKGCNEWRLRWRKNGWKRGEGELKNADLWRTLDEALTAYPITLQWVKGHSGVRGNERADELSMLAIPALDPAKTDDYLTAQYRALMSH